MEILIIFAVFLIFPWLLGLGFVIGPTKAKGFWTMPVKNEIVGAVQQPTVKQTNPTLKINMSESFLENLHRYHAEIADKEDLDPVEYIHNMLECRIQSEKPAQLDFFDRLE